MPQPGLIFRVLVASPGDCAQERKIIPEVSLEMAECLSLLLDKNPANRPQDGIKAAQLLRANCTATASLAPGTAGSTTSLMA